jgi:hypothetical protein
MHPQKRREWVHGVDDTKRVGEFGADVAHGVDDEVLVGDRVADVGEGVGQALDAAAVVVDREIALLQAMEILESIHGALRRVAEEEATDSVPSRERGGAAMKDHVANGFGHGEVNL